MNRKRLLLIIVSVIVVVLIIIPFFIKKAENNLEKAKTQEEKVEVLPVKKEKEVQSKSNAVKIIVEGDKNEKK